jgi:GH24 family phage-related lysozyme (muramidase)
MQISKKGLDLIKSFEGYLRKLPDGSCIAYRCPAGVLTLGWG